MGKFGRAAILVIMGTVLRAVAALIFVLWPAHDLAAWSNFYLAANAVSLIIAFGFFYPRQRLRFRPAVYWRRLADSIYVAGAEVLFYLQMEFDKLLVLSIGGPHLAGIYAIVMRLVDLTAIPIRTFTMMLVQKMMRAPELLSKLSIRAGIESGVFAVSTLALAALAVLLYFFPRALGGNVSEAAPLVGLALLVPAFRNLVEYHAELLFARGQTLIRAINLALLAGLKGILLWWALTRLADTAGMVLSLNLVFAALYHRVGAADLQYAAAACESVLIPPNSREALPVLKQGYFREIRRRIRERSVPMKDCMPIATCSGAMPATKSRNSSSLIALPVQ